MPTVLNEDGFRVVINTDDHRPAHVHVYKSGLVIIKLNHRRTKPSVRNIYGMSVQDVRAALELVTKNKAQLVRQWRKHHADQR
jgi:hypothetical protein